MRTFTLYPLRLTWCIIALCATGALAADTLLDTAQNTPPGADNTWASLVHGSGSVTHTPDLLTLRATGAEWANTNLIATPRADLLFFSRPITLRVQGLGIVAQGTPADQQRARVAITSDGKTPYESASAIGFVVFADGYVSLGYKVGATAEAPNDPENVNVLTTLKCPGPVRNVSLTVGATDWTLVIEHEPPEAGALVTLKRSGKFTDKGPGISAAAWGTSAGVVLQGQKAQGAIENEVTVTIGRFTVAPAQQ